MSRPEPVEELSDDERALLIEALRALRRERGRAWNVACDAADVEGKRQPSLTRFGIDDIKRLARRLGGATHWLEECTAIHDKRLTRFSVPLRLKPRYCRADRSPWAWRLY